MTPPFAYFALTTSYRQQNRDSLQQTGVPCVEPSDPQVGRIVGDGHAGCQ